MIRTIRRLDRPDPGLERVAKANGFSLHAGVSCEGHERNKRERLCRYIARPAVAIPRLSLSSTGKVVYTLKTPYRDGTTQVAFDPVDFMARLAALAWPAASKAQSQSHPLPRRPCPKSSLAWGGHSGQAWQGAKEGRQYRARDTGRAPRGKSLPRFIGYDLGTTTQARLQNRY